jgi:glutathione peroxidase
MTMREIMKISYLLLALSLLFSCSGGETTEVNQGGSTNTEAQAGSSAGSSAGTQAGSSAGTQAGSSAGTSAGSSAGTQAGSSAGTSAGSSAGTQAGDSTQVDAFTINVGGSDQDQYVAPSDLGAPGTGVHAFVMKNINGDDVDLRVYRGKTILIVNVASFCGYTRQYEGLQALFERYRDRGFMILGFPANEFGSQEPGSDQEISDFCSRTYNVQFDMFSKIVVKGDMIHPLYQYLTQQSGQQVSWNFNKFLVDANGNYVHHYLSATEPLSDELTSAIEAQLSANGQ